MTHAAALSYQRDPELLLRLHREMVRLRVIEEAIAERYAEQEMRCPVHLSVGQEAVAVGACAALRRTDVIVSNHRCHAHYIAKGGNLERMIAELYGRATGCSGGRGGSMHQFDVEAGVLVSLPIVASSIPIGVGAALRFKQRGEDRVSLVFMGDAAVEEGVFHESANFAALKRLPVVFVCENNFYSIYTHLGDRQPQRPITDVARAHGMLARHGDGNDALTVYDMVTEAVARARSGGPPSFLVFDTYRWREHCGPNCDDDLGYRTAAEIAAWRERCPVERSRALLANEGLHDDAGEENMNAEIRDEVEKAFDFAKASPFPAPVTAMDCVYA